MTDKIEYPTIQGKRRKPKQVADFFCWQEAFADAPGWLHIILHQVFQHLKGYVHYASSSLCAYYTSEEQAVEALKKAIRKANKKARKCYNEF